MLKYLQKKKYVTIINVHFRLDNPKSRGGLEIRTARASNISIIGKHVWELIHNPDKFWVNLLSSKYLRDISVLEATNY